MVKNFGMNLPQLDLTWANLFSPSCEYINLWQQQQQQQWETCVISNTQICSSCLPQFDSIWRWQHATCQQQQQSKKKVTEHITCLWLISHVPCTDLLSPSLPSTVAVPLLTPSNCRCLPPSSSLAQMLSNRIRNTRRYMTNLPSCTRVSQCVCVCDWVCDSEHDCELAYTPLHTWVGTVGQKTKVNYELKLEKSFAKKKSFIKRLINSKDATTWKKSYSGQCARKRDTLVHYRVPFKS